MNYTKEDYDYMSHFEYHLNTAVNNNFCRIDSRATLVVFDEIYTRTLGKPSKLTKGCSNCILRDIKALANLYFADKAEYEAIEKAQKATETPVEPSEPTNGTETQPKEKKAATTKKTAKNKKK